MCYFATIVILAFAFLPENFLMVSANLLPFPLTVKENVLASVHLRDDLGFWSLSFVDLAEGLVGGTKSLELFLSATRTVWVLQ